VQQFIRFTSSIRNRSSRSLSCFFLFLHLHSSTPERAAFLQRFPHKFARGVIACAVIHDQQIAFICVRSAISGNLTVAQITVHHPCHSNTNLLASVLSRPKIYGYRTSSRVGKSVCKCVSRNIDHLCFLSWTFLCSVEKHQSVILDKTASLWIYESSKPVSQSSCHDLWPTVVFFKKRFKRLQQFCLSCVFVLGIAQSRNARWSTYRDCKKIGIYFRVRFPCLYNDILWPR